MARANKFPEAGVLKYAAASLVVGGLLTAGFRGVCWNVAVLAQSPTDTLSGWLSVVVQLGSFGLITFLIIRGLPALHEKVSSERTLERNAFTAELATERKEFTTALRSVLDERSKDRQDFSANLTRLTEFFQGQAGEVRVAAKAEVEALRSVFAQEQRELRIAFAQEQRDTRDHYAGEAEAMRKLFIEAAAAWRSAVHDVKNVAGVVMNKANVATEIARMQIEGRGPDRHPHSGREGEEA